MIQTILAHALTQIIEHWVTARQKYENGDISAEELIDNHNMLISGTAGLILKMLGER